MPRRWAFLGLVACLAWAEAARGSTLLYLDVGPESFHDGFHRLLTPADGTFSSFRYGRFVQVYFLPSGTETFAYVHLGPRRGARFEPGVYNDATNDEFGDAALLDAGPAPSSCGRSSGEFTLHEIRYDEAENVVALSADFEQRCSVGLTIRGAVRFRVGDATCDGAPGGTPCDDGDPCT